MNKSTANVKPPDLKKDEEAVRRELKTYLEELKAGTLGADSDVSLDAVYVSYHTQAVGGLARLAKILAGTKAR